MNLAKYDLICKLVVSVCFIQLIATFDAFIFQNGLLSRLITGSNKSVSVNIYRFIAKMFMWDWFTGMLNYLGKFSAENNLTKLRSYCIFYCTNLVEWLLCILYL